MVSAPHIWQGWPKAGQKFEASELPCPRLRFVREFDSVPLRCRLRGRFGGCTHVGFELGRHACRSEYLCFLSEFLCFSVSLCLCLCLYLEVGLGVLDLQMCSILGYGVLGEVSLMIQEGYV